MKHITFHFSLLMNRNSVPLSGRFLFSLLALFMVFSNTNTQAQNLSINYTREVTDFDLSARSSRSLLYTESGNALYVTRDVSNIFLVLRDNNVIKWKTKVNVSYLSGGSTVIPDLPDFLYEDALGYYAVGDFIILSGGVGNFTKGMLRFNKASGAIEAFKQLTVYPSNPSYLFTLSGSHGGNVILAGSNGSSAYLQVVDAAGTPQLTKSSSGNGSFWGNHIQSVIKTNDTGYLISGFIEEGTFCSASSSKNRSWWLCKMDKDFNVVWSKKFGNGTGTVDVKKMVQDDSGDIIVLGNTGCTVSSASGPFNFGPGDWLLRLSPAGNYVSGGIINTSTGAKDIAVSCKGGIYALSSKMLTTGSIQYVVESLNSNMNTQATILVGTMSQDLLFRSFPRIQVNRKDNSYMISGFSDIYNKGLIIKTNPDPTCTSPGSTCNLNFERVRYSDCEDFDTRYPGNIVPQASPRFTIFPDQLAENALVTSARAYSGLYSLRFTGYSDIDYNIDRTIQTPARLEWMTLVPAGKTGEWALETIPGAVEALNIKWNNGVGTVYIYENGWVPKTSFSYPQGTWFKTAIIFNLSDNTIELWVGRNKVFERSNYTSGQITDLNFFGDRDSYANEFYIDDIVYYEVSSSCNNSITMMVVVCVDGVEYGTPLSAYCAGYTENEWDNCGPPPPPPTTCSLPGGVNASFSDCENFNLLYPGNLVPQASPRFTVFPATGALSAVVTSARANSLPYSISFTGNADIDYNISRTISTPTRLEWMTYVPSGKTGSWALETIPGAKEAMYIDWNSGVGTVYQYEGSAWVSRASFSYPSNAWFKTVLIFQPARNSVELWVGRNKIFEILSFTSDQITDLNFFTTPGSVSNEFYIDDILYYETSASCSYSGLYAPVCVNTQYQFTNETHALCNAYTSNEWVSGPCGTPPPPPGGITLDIDDNVCGAPGSIIEVPVRAYNLSNVNGLQLTIASLDNSVASIVGYSSSIVATSDFKIDQGKLKFLYAEVSPLSLSGGAILFTIRVQLSSTVGRSTSLVFDGTIIALDANINNISISGLPGSVCTTSATATVSGRIYNPLSGSRSNVTVRALEGAVSRGSTTTNGSGNYLLPSLSTGLNYRISPEYSDVLNRCVNVTDLLRLKQHLLSVTPLANPYSWVAADLNFDKVLNTADLLILRKIILETTTSLSGGQSWRFIPATYSFSTTNPLAGTIPDHISLSPLTGSLTGQDFIAVKYAELDNNCPNLAQSDRTESRSGSGVTLLLPEVTGRPGDEVTVDVRCLNFRKGAAMQFSLSWPTDQLALVDVPRGNEQLLLPGTTLIDSSGLDKGVLSMLWESDDVLNGTSLPDSSICYKLTFRILGEEGAEAVIRDHAEGILPVFVDADIVEQPLAIERGTIRVSTVSSVSESNRDDVTIFPNPTSGHIHIRYGREVPRSVQLLSPDGSHLKQISPSDTSVDMSDMSAGVYMVRMQFENGITIKKVIVLRQ